MFHNLFAATTLATLFTLHGAGILQAAEISAPLALKPLEAISVAAGQTRTVGYFLTENGRCKLVATTAGDQDWSVEEAFSAVRFETAIPAGGTTRYALGDGRALDFKCQEGARSLIVERADSLLASASR